MIRETIGCQPSQSLQKPSKRWNSKREIIQIDIQKNWYGIFIGYNPNTVKHLQVWATKTRQLLITTDPYIDESTQEAKLLANYPILSSSKRKTPTSEPKLCGQPRKPLPEISTLCQHWVTLPTIDALEPPHVEQPLVALSNIVMSAIKVNSQIHKPTKYEEAVSNPIHSQ